jgi:plasmid stability protein
MQITVRNVDDDLARRLKERAAARGTSVNETVLEILRDATGANARRRRLERYANWTAREAARFDDAVRAQRVVDEKLWR